MTRVELPGCHAGTLAGYLKALGLLRVLARQADPAARGHWRGEVFVLTTRMGLDELAGWLVDGYAPSPIVSPWNSGSGFAGNGKSPAAERVLAAFRGSTDPRFAELREAIEAGHELVQVCRQRGFEAQGDGLWKTQHKEEVLRLSRNRLPDGVLPWLDATVALTAGDPRFNPLAGSGGNLGRQDLSSTFLQRLQLVAGEQADRERSLAWARAALSGDESVPYLRDAVGQFDPGRAGGIHSSPREKGDDQGFANPWSTVLALEGVLLFASAAVRRHGGPGRGALPFLVRSTPVGHGSAAEDEQVKGELWAPLWPRPAGLAELEQLLGEGRAEWRGQQARTGLEFALSVAALGVDRNLHSFARFVFADGRFGRSPLAVSAGRVAARKRPEERLLHRPYEWVRRVRALSPPAGVAPVLRRTEQAMFDAATGGGQSGLDRFVIEFGHLHEAVGRSGTLRSRIGPYDPGSRRDQDWLDVLPASPELYLAAGFASMLDEHYPGPDGGMRALLTRVRDERDARGRHRPVWADHPASGLELHARTLSAALAQAHRRRGYTLARAEAPSTGDGDEHPGRDSETTDAGNGPASGEGETGQTGSAAFARGRLVAARLVERFVLGEVDDQLVTDYLRGLLALGCAPSGPVLREPAGAASGPLPPFLAALLPFYGRGELTVTPIHPAEGDTGEAEPMALQPAPRRDWVPRLIAGRFDPLARDVLLRLRLHGCPPVVTPAALAASPPDGARLAAALLLRTPRAGREHALAAVTAVHPAKHDRTHRLATTEGATP